MNEKKKNTKHEYLDSLRKEKDRWEDLLAPLDEAQVVAPILPSQWSIKDVIAHLMAWQQITNARLRAALEGREPEYPHWLKGLDPDDEENLDQINAWIYASYQDKDWPSVYRDWRDGYQRVLEAGEAIPEHDLLEVGKYPWIEGYALSAVLLGTYEHHQEHREPLLALLAD
jgi:hypothetical protein